MPQMPKEGQRVVEGLTIRRVSTSDHVAAALREKILKGELRPGTPLHEVSIAASVGVSRNTMREAIRVLVHEGLIRHSVHRGVTVTKLNEEDVEDIYKVRTMLETAGVKAAKDAGREQIECLSVAVNDIRTAVESRDWNLSVERDMQFHRYLVAFLGSRRLTHFHASLLAELRLGLMLVDRTANTSARLVAQHEELLDLLRAGQYAECNRLLRAHLLESEQFVRATISSQPSRA